MKKLKTNSSNINIDLGYFSSLIGGTNLNDDIMLTVVNQFNRDSFNNLQAPDVPFKLDYLTFIFITNGEVNITIDHIKYKFCKDDLFFMHPENLIVHPSTSTDFYCYLMMVSKEFFEDTILGRKRFSISHIMNIGESQRLKIEKKDTIALKESLDRINYYLRLSSHNFKREILQNSFYNFLLELGNIFVSKNDIALELQPMNRKKQLAHKFMLLLRENGKTEHSPSFYSGKMCISTQYLSILLKEITGKVAKEWINAYLLTEAKILLRYSNVTIQSVSNDLHFYDQASFSKFFKNNMGISPKKYQEEYSKLY